MKKVLIITYYWPPSGGAGVQRWLKFAKYLPQQGWQPVVLTVDPACASYPQRDDSLVGEVPPECLVYTTRSFELYDLYKWVTGKRQVPFGGFADSTHQGLLQRLSLLVRGNLLLPDPRRGWNRYAYRRAVALIREHGIDTVVTTSPPHSTQLIGLKLQRRLGLRWIADLRDPWTDIYYYHQFGHSALALAYDRRCERRVVEQADQLITVSGEVKRLLAAKTPRSVNHKIAVIPNGYDAADFVPVALERESRKVITYTGTISEAYDIDALTGALGALPQALREGLLLRFVGNLPASVEQKFRRSGIDLELTGYVDHARSVRYLLQSDLLLLVIPRVKHNEGIVTGKFFEYLASRRPILAVGPPKGDLAALMDETCCGRLFDYDDGPGMQGYLTQVLQEQTPPLTPVETARQYSREQLTGKIVQLLNAKQGHDT